MFGKEAIDEWALKGECWYDHPEVFDMERSLPRRNVEIIRPKSQDMSWGEGDLFD